MNERLKMLENLLVPGPAEFAGVGLQYVSQWEEEDLLDGSYVFRYVNPKTNVSLELWIDKTGNSMDAFVSNLEDDYFSLYDYYKEKGTKDWKDFDDLEADFETKLNAFLELVKRTVAFKLRRTILGKKTWTSYWFDWFGLK